MSASNHEASIFSDILLIIENDVAYFSAFHHLLSPNVSSVYSELVNLRTESGAGSERLLQVFIQIASKAGSTAQNELGRRRYGITAVLCMMLLKIEGEVLPLVTSVTKKRMCITTGSSTCCEAYGSCGERDIVGDASEKQGSIGSSKDGINSATKSERPELYVVSCDVSASRKNVPLQSTLDANENSYSHLDTINCHVNWSRISVTHGLQALFIMLIVWDVGNHHDSTPRSIVSAPIMK
ncbi:S-adenosylmethionine synthase [Trichinella spiralis]